MWKHFIHGYLAFTKKDRTGIFVLIFFIAFFILLPFFYPFFIKQKSYDHQDFQQAIASLRVKQEDSVERFDNQHPGKNKYEDYPSSYHPRGLSQPIKSELFYFDPNSASLSDWKRLGVRDKTIATIQHYLSKGGKFYKKEDISKIWGLQPEEIARISPYVRITNTGGGVRAIQTEKKFEHNEYKKQVYKIADVDVNKGDSTAFIALPGIGSKLSQRIIHFRDKLGGFYSIEQVGETFGLPDSTFQKIKAHLVIGATVLRQIDINTATLDEMRSHPYIRYLVANAIIQYRTQHGNFTNIADIKKVMAVTDEVFGKLSPYLKVQ